MAHVTKLITFDGRGTLYQLRKAVGYFYAKTAEIYGVKAADHAPVLTDQFKHQYRSLSAEHPNFGATTGMSSQKWWQLMVERTFREAGFNDKLVADRQLAAIAAHLFKQFGTGECWEITNDKVLKTLNDIRSRHPNLVLGVISNNDERLDQMLMQLGLRHFFHFTIDSRSAKVEKPDRLIFELALDHAKLRHAEEAIHVGDDVHTDYLGAKRAGLRALLIARHVDEIKKSTDVIEDEVIKDISDVKAFI